MTLKKGKGAVTRQRRSRSPQVLAMAVVLTLLGCKAANKDATRVDQSYGLNLGQSIALDIDYRTRNISPVSKDARVIIGFSARDGREVITIDGSRLGGGSIRGRFQAYLRGAEVEQGEFSCLYQHTRDVVLNNMADTLKITDLRFTQVIE